MSTESEPSLVKKGVFLMQSGAYTFFTDEEGQKLKVLLMQPETVLEPFVEQLLLRIVRNCETALDTEYLPS